ALTTLPWSLKLLNGFIMDRYTFLAMGRRRAWILGAQSVMIASLVFAAFINPQPTDVLVLGALGFAVNLATTFQDVGVDGLAVDIMTEDERARGSGMMFGGQSIGVAIATAISGFLIDDYGAPAAYLAVAIIILALCVYISAFREREGERFMPWSEGSAHKRNLAIQLEAWWPLLKATFGSLTKSVSVLWLPVLFGRGIMYGVFTGLTPLIGANHGDWEVSEIASVTAPAGLLAGVLCMTLGGWLGDRYGAKRIVILWQTVGILMCGLMYMSVTSWGSTPVFMGFVFAWVSLDMLLTVASLPICMRLCDPKVAATQFTIYMAVANFGISFGAFMLSQADGLGGLLSMFIVVGSGLAVGLLLMLTVRYPRRPEYYSRSTDAAMAYENAGPLQERPGAVRP
ncbi:MAG: MFS transporter, partial [Pseudomonadota bacterium]